jgi:pimeloyl-ACP methyl ester carboxylesterase
MKRSTRVLLTIILIFFLVVLIGPFLVPIPPLDGTKPLNELVDKDSQFVRINTLEVHYKAVLQGDPAFILLHGFGASLYSWHKVMEPLSQLGTVIAYDRVAFGLTERPMSWTGQNPYSPDAQVEQVIGLMDHFGIQKAFLVGNSAGGTIAMLTALKYPERVEALILVDPAVYTGGGSPSWMRLIQNTPQMQHLGPLLVRSIRKWGLDMLKQAWHDPSRITPEDLAAYQKPLMMDNWDKALWNLTLATSNNGLTDRLNELTLPILVITGDDDRIVPTEQSIRLASELPNARLAVIQNSGHVPHEETPLAFMQALNEFLSGLR